MGYFDYEEGNGEYVPETELEILLEKVWNLPRIKNSKIEFADLEGLTEEQLRKMLNLPDRETRKQIKREQRAARVIVPKTRPKLESFDYVERDGKLVRVENWIMANGTDEQFYIPCGDQVNWRGRRVSASIVLHWLRTGEVVKRVPKGKIGKPYRAMIRVNGRLKHLGYFASVEEKNEAVRLAKTFCK